jgi:hypothetical protein
MAEGEGFCAQGCLPYRVDTASDTLCMPTLAVGQISPAHPPFRDPSAAEKLLEVLPRESPYQVRPAKLCYRPGAAKSGCPRPVATLLDPTGRIGPGSRRGPQ